MVDRLEDVVYCKAHLFLVLEWLDLDLKKYMDSSPEFATDIRQIKVSGRFLPFGGLCTLCYKIFFGGDLWSERIVFHLVVI